MTEHTPTPWIAAAKYSSVVGVPVVAQTGKRICNTAFDHHIDDDDAKRLAEANAALIAAAVNNHASMIKSLEQCAKLFDTMAQTLDRWAVESQTGGWSTHQVEENIKRANDCRRYAATIRSALPTGQ